MIQLIRLCKVGLHTWEEKVLLRICKWCRIKETRIINHVGEIVGWERLEVRHEH